MRKWKVAGQEQVLTYPHPAVKLLNGYTTAAATYLHRDALGSVRAITSAAGVKLEAALYKPFGEQSEWVLPGNTSPETKGWIGERFDADAGLQYLNARYYDPELSLFLQPDWFEVTKPGVGTNRFSYSFNDPVNKFDPGGNFGSPPSPDMLEADKKKPKVKTEWEKFTDWFFGNEETRTNRHIENAITEFGLAKSQYDTTLDPKDEMFLEHRKRAYAELGAIGQSSTDEAWNLVGEDAVEAALAGFTLGVGILGPTKTVAVPPQMTAGDIVAPGGSLVGTSMNFAKATERTVTKAEFDAIKDRLLSIANPAKDLKKYTGAQYEFSPAGWMGVRTSTYGETLDFSIPGLKGIFEKLHWK